MSNNDQSNEFEEDDVITKYQPPKEVPLTEILSKDAEDPSLNKYKQQLIGNAINVIIGTIALVINNSIKFILCFI